MVCLRATTYFNAHMLRLIVIMGSAFSWTGRENGTRSVFEPLRIFPFTPTRPSEGVMLVRFWNTLLVDSIGCWVGRTRMDHCAQKEALLRDLAAGIAPKRGSTVVKKPCGPLPKNMC
ncbi:hypothetical protein SAY87_031712 [Trapa incisa]|uniref:Uncharacterized protein n=1 Tax=Trapa incisa TaxID=236973 RepID=A0AAN7KQR1_9MYRT|nr:hypothetical protein SAY87_031712 [Trapa incisa]